MGINSKSEEAGDLLTSEIMWYEIFDSVQKLPPKKLRVLFAGKCPNCKQTKTEDLVRDAKLFCVTAFRNCICKNLIFSDPRIFSLSKGSCAFTVKSR